MLLLSGSLSLLVCSIPLSCDLSTPAKLINKPYVSPTMTLDPWKSYPTMSAEEILEKIFVEELKREYDK